MVSTRLLYSLETTVPPKNFEEEAAQGESPFAGKILDLELA